MHIYQYFLLPHVSEVLLHIRNTNITFGALRHRHICNRATETDWAVYSWPWQSFWGKNDGPWYVTSNRCIPVTNILGWCTVVYWACKLIQLLFVVFCLVRAVQNLDFNLIIQGEHKVFPWLQTFIRRKLRGIQTYFFTIKLVSKKLLELSYILKKKMYST